MIRRGRVQPTLLPFMDQNPTYITSEKRVAEKGDRLYKDKNGQK